MEKRYYERPYVKTFEAVICSCRQGNRGNYEVILDQTGFYPEGGGQPGDTGFIGGAHVLDVHEKPEGIVHETDSPLEVGSSVICSLDWDTRFYYMQNHSGEHLLSGLIHKYHGYDNVGFHMGKEEVTVDFNGILTMEQIETIETEVNQLIYDNLPIVESYPSTEELTKLSYRSKKELSGQVRIIEIPGGDVCACCGTHVMATGEIGCLKVTGMIHYKGGVRLTMVCGNRALEDYRRKQKMTTAISVLLSAKPSCIVEAVEKLKKESVQKDGKLSQLQQELFTAKLMQYEESRKPLIVFEKELEPVWLRRFCTLLYENQKGSVVLVCSGENENFQYALGSMEKDMRAFSKSMNNRLHGRGGGSTLLAQGTFQASEEDIRNVFAEQ